MNNGNHEDIRKKMETGGLPIGKKESQVSTIMLHCIRKAGNCIQKQDMPFCTVCMHQRKGSQQARKYDVLFSM